MQIRSSFGVIIVMRLRKLLQHWSKNMVKDQSLNFTVEINRLGGKMKQNSCPLHPAGLWFQLNPQVGEAILGLMRTSLSTFQIITTWKCGCSLRIEAIETD